jgi:hypothetical protein
MSQTKPTLRATKDYRLFTHSRDNRPTDLSNRKVLQGSMEKYGFLPAYPLHCVRAKDGKLEIRDGQHRFAIAQKLGISVWYVVLEDSASIPEINAGAIRWSPKNYAQCFAAQGNADYSELIAFAAEYSMPISLSAAILSGTICARNLSSVFHSGAFRVKSRERANSIAVVYSALIRLSKKVRNARMLEALYSVSYIPGIEMKRIIEGAERCPEKLIAYGTRDAYLTLLEDLYNFGRRVRVAIKIPAENAMRSRNPVQAKQAAAPTPR